MGLKIDETEKSIGYLKKLKGIIHFVNLSYDDINKHFIEIAIPNKKAVPPAESAKSGKSKAIRARGGIN